MVYEWSDEELERLDEMLADRNPPAVIAEALGIPVASVCGKISQRMAKRGLPAKHGNAPVVRSKDIGPAVSACIEQDSKAFRKMLAVVSTCQAAGVPMPQEVARYFGVGVSNHAAVSHDTPPVRWIGVRHISNADGSLRGYAVDMAQVAGAKTLLIVIGETEE